jgi:hypothetical protein
LPRRGGVPRSRSCSAPGARRSASEHRYSPQRVSTHVPLTCVDRSCTRTILMSLGSSL